MPAYVAPTYRTTPTHGGGAFVNQFTLDSVASTGLITTPAAGQTITMLQVPQSGKYAVNLLYGAGATAPAVENNLRLQVGSITVSSLTMVASANTVQAMAFILTVPSDQWIGLNAIGAGAGRYIATIVATKL